jgi:hypothetical protein
MQLGLIFHLLPSLSRHNEDGSYSYGYEAADGSFKLETRYPDGLVQGKYGYVDIDTGELKVIEYGADMMGFQPMGDLPEGIIIPPPVFNNLTDDQGDPVDYDDPEIVRPNLQAHNVRVENRARTANQFLGGSTQTRPRTVAAERQQSVRQPAPKQPDQNRGQELQQPITPRPLPRAPSPQARPQQIDQSRFQTNFALPEPTQPTPAASRPQRPLPAPESATTGTRSRNRARLPIRGRPRQQQEQPQQEQQQQPQLQQARKQQQQPPAQPRPVAPLRVFDPSPGGIPDDPLAALRAIVGPGAFRGGAQLGEQPTGTRSRTPSRARGASRASSQAAPERPRGASVSNRQPTGNRFSSFPARGGSSAASSSQSRRPVAPSQDEQQEAAAPVPSRPIRIRQRPSELSQQSRQPVPPQPTPFQPQFEAEQPRAPQILPPRPQSRPRFNNQNGAQAPPGAGVSFDALIQEFTGGRTNSFPPPLPQQQRFPPRRQQQQQHLSNLQSVPAVPGLSGVDGAAFSLVTG